MTGSSFNVLSSNPLSITLRGNGRIRDGLKYDICIFLKMVMREGYVVFVFLISNILKVNSSLGDD